MVVSASWHADTHINLLTRIAIRIKQVRKSLGKWSHGTFGDAFEVVKDARDEVLRAEAKGDQSGQGRAAIFEARAKVKLCLAREESYWRQKARVKWDIEGERNTKYFHGCVQSKRQKLHVHQVYEEGHCITDQKAILGAAKNFYDKLLRWEGPSRTGNLLDSIPRLITEEDNGMLCTDTTIEAVKLIVFLLIADSTTGPDGLYGLFVQTCWDIISQDVWEAVVAFFYGLGLPRPITSTLLILIQQFPLGTTSLLAYATLSTSSSPNLWLADWLRFCQELFCRSSLPL